MRLFLILSVLSFSLFASYEKAQEFYENKEYQNAIAEAKASTDEYANPKLHMIWAKSEQALGHTKEAMAAYERVAMLDETNVEARVALIEIYANTNRSGLNQEMYEELKDLKLTRAQQKVLESHKEDGTAKIDLQGGIALGYDTNLNTSPGDGIINNYPGVISLTGEKGSLFTRLNANLRHTKKFGAQGRWYYQRDFRVYIQNNADAHLYDLLYGALKVGVGYKGDSYNIYIPASYNRVQFLQTDLFGEYALSPRASFSVSKNLIINLNAEYAKRGYVHDGDQGLDEKILRFGIGGFYVIGADYLYFNLFRDDYSSDTSKTAVEYVNRKTLTLNMGIKYNIASKLNVKLDYRFRKASYDDYARISTTLLSTEKRSDDFHQGELKLGYKLGDKSELYIVDQYGTNGSNYSLVEYHKNVTMLGVSVEF